MRSFKSSTLECSYGMFQRVVPAPCVIAESHTCVVPGRLTARAIWGCADSKIAASPKPATFRPGPSSDLHGVHHLVTR